MPLACCSYNITLGSVLGFLTAPALPSASCLPCVPVPRRVLSVLSYHPYGWMAIAGYVRLVSLVAQGLGSGEVCYSGPDSILGRPCVFGSRRWEFFNDHDSPSCGSQTALCLWQILYGEEFPAALSAVGDL